MCPVMRPLRRRRRDIRLFSLGDQDEETALSQPSWLKFPTDRESSLWFASHSSRPRCEMQPAAFNGDETRVVATTTTTTRGASFLPSFQLNGNQVHYHRGLLIKQQALAKPLGKLVSCDWRYSQRKISAPFTIYHTLNPLHKVAALMKQQPAAAAAYLHCRSHKPLAVGDYR